MTREDLTRKRAIEEHRKMWNWIADETEKRNKIITKEDYFAEHSGLRICGYVPNINCWCCEYVIFNSSGCKSCPILWLLDDKYKYATCTDEQSPFHKWAESISIMVRAHYAREIANLPEREDK